MLITRRDLRMAFTAGLGNGFSYLSGIPFGYYVPLAVFATAGGTYGGGLALGRPRIPGTTARNRSTPPGKPPPALSAAERERRQEELMRMGEEEARP